MNTLHRTLAGSPNKRERLYQLQLETATNFSATVSVLAGVRKEDPLKSLFFLLSDDLILDFVVCGLRNDLSRDQL